MAAVWGRVEVDGAAGKRGRGGGGGATEAAVKGGDDKQRWPLGGWGEGGRGAADAEGGVQGAEGTRCEKSVNEHVPRGGGRASPGDG